MKKLKLKLSTIRTLTATDLIRVGGGAIKESCDPNDPCAPPPPTADPTYMGCPSAVPTCCC